MSSGIAGLGAGDEGGWCHLHGEDGSHATSNSFPDSAARAEIQLNSLSDSLVNEADLAPFCDSLAWYYFDSETGKLIYSGPLCGSQTSIVTLEGGKVPGQAESESDSLPKAADSNRLVDPPIIPGQQEVGILPLIENGIGVPTKPKIGPETNTHQRENPFPWDDAYKDVVDPLTDAALKSRKVLERVARPLEKTLPTDRTQSKTNSRKRAARRKENKKANQKASRKRNRGVKPTGKQKAPRPPRAPNPTKEEGRKTRKRSRRRADRKLDKIRKLKEIVKVVDGVNDAIDFAIGGHALFTGQYTKAIEKLEGVVPFLPVIAWGANEVFPREDGRSWEEFLGEGGLADYVADQLERKGYDLRDIWPWK